MTNEKRTLVQHEGKLYVQLDTVGYVDPIAYRLWWEVSRVIWSPYAVGVERELPIGQALRPIPGSLSGEPTYSTTHCSIFMPEGGKTKACRKWSAPVPRPRKDAVWRDGWFMQLKRGEKSFPIKWDELEWTESET